MTLKSQAIRGLKWSALEKISQHFTTFITFLILARLLEPKDFGLVALASVFTALIRVFLDQGLSIAIIQRYQIDNIYLDTAFWINIFLGILFTIGGIFSSTIIAHFLREPLLAPIIAWLSLEFILESLIITQLSILQRKFDFRSLAIRNAVARTVSGIGGIIAAISGAGVWSLVIQTLIYSVISVIVLWTVSSWRPRFRFSWKYYKELFTFGVNVLGSRIINFIDLRVDQLLIGYFLNSTQLGYYVIGYKLILVMQDLLMGITYNVVFVTFSKLQKDIKRLQRTFYLVTKFISLVSWPIFFGLAILGPELVSVFFGDKWMPSIVIMQILALASIPIVILVYGGNLSVSQGKPSYHFFTRLMISAVRVSGFLIAVKMGITAVAFSFMLVSYLVYAPLNIWLSIKFAKIEIKKYLSIQIVPVTSSILMAIAIFGMKSTMFINLHPILDISIFILFGILIYSVIIWLLYPGIYLYFKNVKKEFMF